MLYLDFETFNTQDISVGAYKYAETAEILLAAYAIDDGPVKVWDATCQEIPEELAFELLNYYVTICAHNAQFDRLTADSCLPQQCGTPERWTCTMAQAYSHALPGNLEALGAALGIPADKAKIADGKKLIQRFCKPAPASHKAERYDRTSHPEEWARFVDYAARDVEAMREIHKRLPTQNWKQKDIDLYHLDQRINDRGFKVDLELTHAGAKAAEQHTELLGREFTALTKGSVTSPKAYKQFCDYLNTNFDLSLEGVSAPALREALDTDDLHPEAKRLIEIALASNKSSTAKYATLAAATSSDGRFRGGLRFRGASRTRRWSGQTFQPQNLPSRGLPDQPDVDAYIRAVKVGAHDLLFDDQLLYASAALRGVLVAPEGKKLAVADLSNIEGRILAYLAGETWKLDAFRAFDAGKGPDLYNITATSILGGDPYKVSQANRNAFGKVPDLALGYAGGFGALQTFAKTYSVKFADYESTILSNVSPELLLKAEENYATWGQAMAPDAPFKEWYLSEAVKLSWRQRHAATSALWKACENAARSSITSPGVGFDAGSHLKFMVKRIAEMNYLFCRLPSGSFLCYADPKIARGHKKFEDGTITYMGTDSGVKGGVFAQWTRLSTYGGKLVENACQSLAADIMAHGMQEAEDDGFEIVLTVHDEIVAEDGLEGGSTNTTLAEFMATPPDWLGDDMPLAAAGFETDRYRKD